MKDKSLEAQPSPAATEPEAPSASHEEQAPAINSVEAMLEDRFKEIEQGVSQPAAEPAPEAEEEEKPETPAAEPEAEEEEPEAPETEEEPEGEPEEEEPEEEAEEEEEIEGLNKVPDDVQQRINKKIGKLTAQRKAAEERITALEAENTELKEKAAHSGMTAEEAKAVARAGLPPEYLTTDEAKIVKDAETHRNEVRWAFENLDGATIGDQEYSAAQMRAYYLRVQDKYEALKAQAAGILEGKITEYREDLKTARELRAKKNRIQSVKPTGKKTDTKKPAKPAPSAPPPAASRKPPVSSPSRSPNRDLRSLQESEDGVTMKALQEAMEAVF